MRELHRIAEDYGSGAQFVGIEFNGESPRGGFFDRLAIWFEINVTHLKIEDVQAVQHALKDAESACDLEPTGVWKDDWRKALVAIIGMGRIQHGRAIQDAHPIGA